ncbi:AAA family ATPase [Mucilaginibacter sp. KACC 22063]|uniref:AAA family ATPase n=1 Tax=Mucilaginibacter sp. KACC 22063 TaxID=3025666 RepID=UPI0023662443|nr:AAA family ATPase [Mucilaginibacter sp. KACC 22063]WDF55773.1 AAA family ATPase [Mucilaginibacter sp. KACC 22063]
MKISIENFKAIRSLADYELKPLTVLSGVNSSGKSSLIQLLLLLKQTLQLDSTKNPLLLNGDFYQVGSFKDILTNKDLSKSLKVGFEFSKEEDIALNTGKRITLFDAYETFTIKVEVTFEQHDEQIGISDFFILYQLPTGDKREQYVRFQTIVGENTKYKIEASNLLFGDELWGTDANVTDLQFSSIFPNYYEITELEVAEGTKRSEENIHQQNTTKYFPKIAGIKSLLDRKFASVSYIGPLREQPKDLYPMSSRKRHVGNLGEFTAQVLENFAGETINFLNPALAPSGISYEAIEVPLLTGVKIWMCDIFKIGKDIFSKKQGESYSIVLTNDAGIETTIKHVGFGISQVLPIIVEGLLMEIDGTLILEQPEIHLHPKVQSLLFDFLYSLVLQGKNVIIETHSDHFITRMRRRIAESQNEDLLNALNLTFIEAQDGEVYFEIIELDDMGTIDYFPEDFIEQSNLELKAIVQAQMNKRMRGN